MVEIRLFIDILPGTANEVRINTFIAELLKLNNGDSVEVVNPENNRSKIVNVLISDMVLDISMETSLNITEELNLIGTELIIRELQKDSIPS